MFPKLLKNPRSRQSAKGVHARADFIGQTTVASGALKCDGFSSVCQSDLQASILVAISCAIVTTALVCHDSAFIAVVTAIQRSSNCSSTSSSSSSSSSSKSRSRRMVRIESRSCRCCRAAISMSTLRSQKLQPCFGYSGPNIEG